MRQIRPIPARLHAWSATNASFSWIIYPLASDGALVLQAFCISRDKHIAVVEGEAVGGSVKFADLIMILISRISAALAAGTLPLSAPARR